MIKGIWLTLIAACMYSSFSWSAPVATEASVNGDDVIARVDQHETGYQSLSSNVTLLIVDNKGKIKERFLKAYTLEEQPFGDKRKFVFYQPRDINGTSVLIHSNVIKDDYQWIYLPAFKRVKRIASSNKTTPFVGSEFSYEDLSSQEKEKYENKLIGEETINGIECYVVERRPKYDNSAYQRIIAYIDKEYFRYRKVDYFDHQNKLLKTQLLDDYQLFDGRYWLSQKNIMTNHHNGKHSTMLWMDIEVKAKLSDSHFSLSALKRTR